MYNISPIWNSGLWNLSLYGFPKQSFFGRKLQHFPSNNERRQWSVQYSLTFSDAFWRSRLIITLCQECKKKLSISFSLQCVHCLIYYQVKGHCKDSFGNLENKPYKSSLEFFSKFSLCLIQKSSIHTSKNLRFNSRVVSI